MKIPYVKKLGKDVPDSLVARTWQGAQVRSLVGELNHVLQLKIPPSTTKRKKPCMLWLGIPSAYS